MNSCDERDRSRRGGTKAFLVRGWVLNCRQDAHDDFVSVARHSVGPLRFQNHNDPNGRWSTSILPFHLYRLNTVVIERNRTWSVAGKSPGEVEHQPLRFASPGDTRTDGRGKGHLDSHAALVLEEFEFLDRGGSACRLRPCSGRKSQQGSKIYKSLHSLLHSREKVMQWCKPLFL